MDEEWLKMDKKWHIYAKERNRVKLAFQPWCVDENIYSDLPLGIGTQDNISWACLK